ncbi:hypothetical protein [Thermomonospora cellulosilytica]|uniref:Uncharacterized protein n=1 Tax=Thermomonospora cellulosilytica TaxID=1411118 RepID=A0A7W3MXJ9_9ACTN|nr:hypothetical protein [Thermomonospora cellulosilytica]MBA9003667.1 hypothetical protein [Thermomonospora cellulosilytica]
MVTRRRAATREELEQILAERGIDQDTARPVLDALTDLAGQPVEDLVRVRIEIDEEV